MFKLTTGKKVFPILVLLMTTSIAAYAQRDTTFWFAAPFIDQFKARGRSNPVSVQHRIPGAHYSGFGRFHEQVG